MPEFFRDSFLISRAEFALTGLRRILDELHVLHNDLESLYQSYLSLDRPQPEVEVRLRASVSLFESYFYGQSSIFQKADERSIAQPPTTLVLLMNGEWLTHEMGQLLFSLNTIFHLFAVRDIALPRIDVDIARLRTRRDVYDNAKLFYYLRPDEELKIWRLQFASPGEIEIITKLAELVPALKDVIVVMFAASIASRFIRQLPSMYRQWVQERIAVRQLQREDEKSRLIHEFFIQTMRQHIQPNVFGDDTVRVTNAINLLSNSINQIASQRVAEPVNLTSRLLGALASLERLFNNGKLAIPRPEDGSDGSNASKDEK